MAHPAILLPSDSPGQKKISPSGSSQRSVHQESDRNVLSRRPISIQINRLSAIKQSLPNNIPEKIKLKMMNNIALSSIKTYQRCWESFANFVKKKQKLHCSVKLVMVYRFFNFLILKGNKYKTLLVYRSALKRLIKSLFPHYNVESDENLKNLMLCVKNKFKKSIETPLWDLDKV